TAEALNMLRLVAPAAGELTHFNPATFQVWGSNSRSGWDDAGWQELGGGVTGFQSPVGRLESAVESMLFFGNDTPYRFYKVVFPQLSGIAASLIPDAHLQLAEAELFQAVQRPQSVGESFGTVPEGAGVDKAIDGEPGTNYVNLEGSGTGLTMSFADPLAMNTLWLASRSGDSLWQTDPAAVAIYGMESGDTDWDAPGWVKLGEAETGLADEQGSVSLIRFANDAAYRHYRIEFTATKADREGLPNQGVQVADVRLMRAVMGSAAINVRPLAEAITSSEAGGTGVQVFGAVYEAPKLLASFEPGAGASGDTALEAVAHEGGLSVGELWQSEPVAAGADGRWPAFQNETQTELDPERYVSFTVTPLSTQSGDKLVRVAAIEMTTRSFQGQGARYAALAHSGDGFNSFVKLELDPTAELETLRFDLGNLEVEEETEFRIYVWGMSASADADGNLQGSDAEYLASSSDAGFDAGLRIHGWIENQPPERIEASIGQMSARTVISVPGTLNELPESQRALLAKAGPDDIVDIRYQVWEYLGEDTTLDLADENAFVSPSQWRKVGANETQAAGAPPVLASTDGFADVQRGQWVKDRRTVRAITLQIVSDL
ncbi:MAG: hypothetical protein KGR68_18915, partial [Betaproteobacteria bacterium]|nr:hypothetical protein [Betaproteobacteria bacterium]